MQPAIWVFLSNLIENCTTGYLALIIICFLLYYVTDRKLYSISLLSTGGLLFVVISIISGCAFISEYINAYLSGNPYEQFVLFNRPLSLFGWIFWFLIFSNLLVPQLLWFRKLRKNLWVALIIALFSISNFWLERLMTIMMSIHGEFATVSWAIKREPFWSVLYFFVPYTLGFLFVAFGLNYLNKRRLVVN
jgi:hypothetical protein